MGHPDFGNIVPCSCQQAKLESQRLADLRAVSNLDGMARYTFEAFKSDGVGLPEAKRTNVHTVYETARRYAADPRGWLVLLGGYGCGKTHLAVAIANEQLARGRSALFVVVPDLLDYLRATYSPHSAVTYDQRFDNVRNAPLLILDDLGTQSSTEWAKEKLYQVFNYRYNARLPTVVTSNQELEAIDARIRSRLIDPDLVQICTLLAPDFRATGADSMDHELSSLTMHVDQVFESFDLRERELSREEVESLQQALTFARNYAADPEDWLVLTGGYGCGKTHLAAAIANERVNQRASVLFVVVPDLLDHLRATYAPDSQISYDRRLDQVRTTPLLVLDDLGTHSATPWAQEKLYQIFNYRYNARLPTVITVADGVSVDERLKSRLFDRRRCINLKIDAPSYRGSETEAKRRSAKR
ncbi:MAG: ATP-binding protein [Ardenticatenia bacterium]|nr:ATP-binding protein [Ardenticatenia bacterium]